MDIGLLLIALAAFGGGVLSSFLGFLDSGEPFNGRIFGKSLVMALIAGLGFAVGYSFTDGVGTRDFFLAILSGAGFDALSNRAIGALKGKR